MLRFPLAASLLGAAAAASAGSAFDGYQPFTDAALAPWRGSNQAVGSAAPGHGAHASPATRPASAPAAAPAIQPPARPATHHAH